MKRIVYVLVPTCKAMTDDSMNKINFLLQNNISRARINPYLLESLYICIILFDEKPTLLFPVSPICDISIPKIKVSDSSVVNFKSAIASLNIESSKSIIQIYVDDRIFRHQMMKEVIKKLYDFKGLAMGGMIFNVDKLDKSDYCDFGLYWDWLISSFAGDTFNTFLNDIYSNNPNIIGVNL